MDPNTGLMRTRSWLSLNTCEYHVVPLIARHRPSFFLESEQRRAPKADAHPNGVFEICHPGVDPDGG